MVEALIAWREADALHAANGACAETAAAYARARDLREAALGDRR